MAITDAQKVDYLYKKLGYGVAKTDTSSVKSPSNESIASALLVRGDTIWNQSDLIPAIAPASNSSVVTCYTGTSSIQSVNDGTASTNRTWKTNLTNWIGTEFGATYQPRVYAAPSGTANAAATGTRLFPDGSGNSDSWFFDPQSGVLNFADTNVPSSVTGNVVFVEGYRYTGTTGINNAVPTTGNITFSGNTISTSETNGNIVIAPTGSGFVIVDTTTGLVVPTGTTAQGPSPAPLGTIRFNTDTSILEYWNGTNWYSTVPSITSQIIYADGVNSAFTLSQSATTNGVVVSINGTVQMPSLAYSVSGTTITFVEVPQSTDVIEVRFITLAASTADTLANITITNTATVANLVVNTTANIVYADITNLDVLGNANVATTVITRSNSAISSATTFDSFSTAKYQAAKYFITATNSSGDRSVADIMVSHNGTAANVSVYGIVNTSAVTLVTVTGTISSGNVLVQATSNSTGVQLKYGVTYITV